MVKKLSIIIAAWLISSGVYASCVLEKETDEQNFTRCSEQAEKGNADAQFVLGGMYYEGEGVAQDYHKSIQWYQKSAEQGNVIAQASLGMLYARGVGVAEDQVSALMWLNIADANGLEAIVLYRTTLLSLMTKDQIEQAKFLSETWIEKH